MGTTNVQVLLSDNKVLSATGELEAEIQIGGSSVRHRFIVATIGNDMLLGLDFLRKERCIIDVANKCLEWGGLVLPLWETAEKQNS